MEAAGRETPEEHLKNHALTAQLRQCGITDAQLEAVRFFGTNKGVPFELWPITYHPDTPIEHLSSLRAYCALKWLVLNDPPPSSDTREAWRLVSDFMVAPIFARGLEFSKSQSDKAKNPRGKVNEDGATIDQMIDRLVRRVEYETASAAELWLHFFAMLDTECLNPKEIPHTDDPRKTAYRYTPMGSTTQRTLTFGRFQNVVSEIRRKKKSR